MVHQVNYLYEVPKLKQNFRKNEAVAGKTLFFLISPSCTPRSTVLNIGFWHDTLVWKCCVFNLSTFNEKTVLEFFEKGSHFAENLFQIWSIENAQNFQWLSYKTMMISQTEGYFKNPSYRFLEEPMLFLLAWKWNF